MFRQLDIKLILSMFLIFSIGLVSIYSSTYKEDKPLSMFFYKQLFWMLLGLSGVFVLMKIGTRKILEYSYYLYAVSMIFLVLVLFIGVSRGGGHRWLKVANFTFQPSEFVKLSVILVIARFLSKFKNNQVKFNFKDSLIIILLLGCPLFLIILQPDLGTGLVFIPVALAMWYASGIGTRNLTIFSILSVLSSPFWWGILKDYQKQRLLVFLKPDLDPLGAGYTVIQSKIAIGSGKIMGKGWLSGTQNILNFLPERHTDFIFSVIGEEWGFIGALIILSLYVYLLLKALKIGANTNNKDYKLVVVGIVVLLAVHVIINMGMTMGIIPAVGLPLPFVSYGGSNLIVSILCIGFLLDIERKTK